MRMLLLRSMKDTWRWLFAVPSLTASQADLAGGTIRAATLRTFSPSQSPSPSASQAPSPSICIAAELGEPQVAAGGAPWPAWRRDPAHTASSADAASGLTAWRFQTGGAIQSSPALAGGILYIGSDDTHAYAIDIKTGALVGVVPTDGVIMASPAVGSDGVVYIATRANTVIALDSTTGEARWTFRARADFVASPALSADGSALFIGGTNSIFYALNTEPEQQRVRWNATVGGPTQSSPALSSDGSILYFGCDDGGIYALHASNGTILWFHQTGGVVRSSPALSGGALFVGSVDRKVYALNSATGKCLRVVLYVVTRATFFASLFLRAGRELWTFETQGGISSSPTVGGGAIVFVASFDSYVYALSAATGSLRWRYQTGGPVYSSPALDAAGVIYVGSDDGRIHAIDGCSGKSRWQYYAGNSVHSSPAVSGGTVFVGSMNGIVFALAPVDPGYTYDAGTVILCPAGFYCPGYYDLAAPCPIGTYGPASGAVNAASCLACRVGTYTASAGLSVCSSAPQAGAMWPVRGRDSAHTSRSASFEATSSSWMFTAPGFDIGAPILGPRGAVYVRCSGTLYALRSSSSGALMWQYDLASPTNSVVDTLGLSAAAVAADGTVYVGSAGDASGNGAGAYAVDGTTGTYKWFMQFYFTVYSSPAIGADGTTFWTCADSTVYALRQGSGEILWTYHTPSGTGGFIGSPTLGATAIYVTCGNGDIVALDPSTGAKLWGFSTRDSLSSTPALWTTANGDEIVFVGGQDSLAYALNGTNGALKWRYQTSGPIYDLASVGPTGTVYFGCTGGIFAFDGASGELLWSYAVTGLVAGFALGTDGEVYFTSSTDTRPGSAGLLGALNGTTGATLWMPRPLQGAITAPVLASDGTVFLSARDKTYGYVFAIVPARPGYWIDTTLDPSPGQSVTTATLCEAGYYCTGGFALALQCPPGQYNSLQGASSCTPCPAGTYNALSGASVVASCLSCPLGSASAAIGASSSDVCVVCGPGTYAGLGASTCTECPRGTYFGGTGGSSSAVCVLAAAGESVALPGASAPDLCDPGTYSAAPGACVAVVVEG
jgi:outer membrane protein assembly factor BamB